MREVDREVLSASLPPRNREGPPSRMGTTTQLPVEIAASNDNGHPPGNRHPSDPANPENELLDAAVIAVACMEI